MLSLLRVQNSGLTDFVRNTLLLFFYSRLYFSKKVDFFCERQYSQLARLSLMVVLFAINLSDVLHHRGNQLIVMMAKYGLSYSDYFHSVAAVSI